VIGPGEEFDPSLGWRLIGTMNTLDKNLLFELSYAFMRRFTFVELGAPDEDWNAPGLVDTLE
jgi:MoxR-like ATPase